MSEPLWQPRTDFAARLLGAGFLTGGFALLAYQAKSILDSITAREENVTYLMSAIGLGEMGVILGAYWIIRGLAGYQTVRTLQQNPRRMRMLLLVSIIVIGGTLLGLRAWLTGHGYE